MDIHERMSASIKTGTDGFEATFRSQMLQTELGISSNEDAEASKVF
jgi:hypothetical protein